MTYRAEFEGGALVQLNGLPRAAFDALVERVAVLVRGPWDAQLVAPGADPPTGRPYSEPAGACCPSASMRRLN